mgnify:CR=1 FL=1|tara:strand:- start:5207 stop:5569 length:363 start_codon:yes stop_codon:yes gene_type:complete
MYAKVLIFNILIGVLFLSCGNKNNIHSKNGGGSQERIIPTKVEELLVGDWVESNPIDEREVQGIKLLEGGNAKSINMATLIYLKWWVHDGHLFLEAQSLGNGLFATDSTAFDILKIDRDS